MLYTSFAFTNEDLSHLYVPSTIGAAFPWFTGPLLAPSPYTAPPKHFDTEPYLFLWSFTGNYNEDWKANSLPHFYTMLLLLPAWVGITSFLDFGIETQLLYQFTQGKRSTQFGDIPFGFGIQLLNTELGSLCPSMKMSLHARIPTGKFDNLNPSKLGTDGVGDGNWRPAACITLGQIFQLSNKHFFSPSLSFNYAVPTPLHVSNKNVYGGTKGTKGTVYPGNNFWYDLSLEYNFTQRWAFAIDITYEHWNKCRFSGKTPVIMTRPSAEQFTLAPAIEYNWSSSLGLIGGVWFTVAGRNSNRFITGTLALTIDL